MPSSCLHPPANHMPAQGSGSLCIHSWSKKKKERKKSSFLVLNQNQYDFISLQTMMIQMTVQMEGYLTVIDEKQKTIYCI